MKCKTCDSQLEPDFTCPYNGQTAYPPAPQHVAKDLIAIKQQGGDCTADESAWIMAFFDSFHPEITPQGAALADAFPLERDQWFYEVEEGHRESRVIRGVRRDQWLELSTTAEIHRSLDRIIKRTT